MSVRSEEALYAAVGFGEISAAAVFNRLTEKERREEERAKAKAEAEELMNGGEVKTEKKEVLKVKSENGVIIQGASGLLMRIAKCCNPVPGDEIVGFITRGRGISIHRTDCVNLLNMPESDRARLIEAEWQVSEADTTQTYTTEINIYANNRKGLLAEVSKIFLELDIDIITINVSNNKKGRATLSMSFDITGVEQLNRIITKIRNVEGVIDIERTAG